MALARDSLAADRCGSAAPRSPASSTTSRRRSSVSFPNLKAHQAASRISAYWCSGIAAVSLVSSGRLAGRILCTRLVVAAPRITHGFRPIFPSLAALPMMLRNSP